MKFKRKNQKQIKDKEKTEILCKFSQCIPEMLKNGFTKEEIKKAIRIGFEAYYYFNNPKVIKISGEKEDIIKQIKRLELEKEVEKNLINIINNECL